MSEFKGPIQDVRFVKLVDARTVMQYQAADGTWITPPVVDVMTLSQNERYEIQQAISRALHE